MRIDVLTIFPRMFEGVFGESIIKRAQEKNAAIINVHDIREYSDDKHKRVDDYPYGGGAGMVMMVQPFHAALEAVKKTATSTPLVCLMCPRGKVLDQALVKRLAEVDHLVLIAGHYEGYDERVREFCDEEISLGDFILTGGELPAMVVTDAIIRLLPNVLGDEMSAVDESFSDYLLEYPQYTRPREYQGLSVPEVLFSGHHANVAKWRRMQALKITLKNRPDLLEKYKPTTADEKLLKEIRAELKK